MAKAAVRHPWKQTLRSVCQTLTRESSQEAPLWWERGAEVWWREQLNCCRHHRSIACPIGTGRLGDSSRLSRGEAGPLCPCPLPACHCPSIQVALLHPLQSHVRGGSWPCRSLIVHPLPTVVLWQGVGHAGWGLPDERLHVCSLFSQRLANLSVGEASVENHFAVSETGLYATGGEEDTGVFRGFPTRGSDVQGRNTAWVSVFRGFKEICAPLGDQHGGKEGLPDLCVSCSLLELGLGWLVFWKVPL